MAAGNILNFPSCICI